MAAERRFNQALRALVDALDEIPGPSMIIGGVAVIASGVPRQTVDIDATVLGRAAALDDVVATLARHGIKPRKRCWETSKDRLPLIRPSATFSPRGGEKGNKRRCMCRSACVAALHIGACAPGGGLKPALRLLSRVGR